MLKREWRQFRNPGLVKVSSVSLSDPLPRKSAVIRSQLVKQVWCYAVRRHNMWRKQMNEDLGGSLKLLY